MKFKNIIMLIIVLICVLLSASVLVKKPSHNRNWELGQEKLPQIEISNSKVVVNNFRNFDWKSNTVAKVNYSQEDFDFDKFKGIELVISHFSKYEGMAHIFLIFRFEDEKNMVISMEARREKGENFAPLLGLFREFEVIYVIGSERDVLGLRTDIRKERINLYPTSFNKEEAQRLFSLIAKDVNKVYDNPTFYNTFFNNCANVITDKIEKVYDIKFSKIYETIMPGLIDKVFYRAKLIPTEKSFSETKNYYQIDNDEVNRYSPDYLDQIRKK